MTDAHTPLGDRPILYMTYDGLTDPLGRSQILPYLLGCARRGHRIVILSCEKPDRFEQDRATVEGLCQDAGIVWHPLRYHKRPAVLSSVYDVQKLKRAGLRLSREYEFGLIHCRSYMASAAGLFLKRRLGIPLIFDMRGFWPEERTEGGSWNLENPLFRAVYRYFKRLESALLTEAGAIVSLTEAGREELLQRPELRGQAQRIWVIPCCVDFAHFLLGNEVERARARSELSIPEESSVLAYLGSLGGNYMLEEMLDLFLAYRTRHPGARFLFITQGEAAPILSAAAERGIAKDEIVIRSAGRNDVPRLLAAADLGIAFKQPSFSAKACSPTKLGEMMAVGVPVIANAGVGDVDAIIETTKGGAIVGRFTNDRYVAALEAVETDPPPPADLRQNAIGCFDLQSGIDRYDGLYRQLAP